ncbi:MAG: DUF2905 domain-containing protein [Anaerolineae bacterium]|jgi:hypothetical protein
MFDFQGLGRILLIIGGSLALVGLLFILGGRFFPWLGRLPGDIHYQGKNISCFFPIVTSILLSIVLTLLLNLIIRLLNR